MVSATSIARAIVPYSPECSTAIRTARAPRVKSLPGHAILHRSVPTRSGASNKARAVRFAFLRIVVPAQFPEHAHISTTSWAGSTFPSPLRASARVHSPSGGRRRRPFRGGRARGSTSRIPLRIPGCGAGANGPSRWRARVTTLGYRIASNGLAVRPVRPCAVLLPCRHSRPAQGTRGSRSAARPWPSAARLLVSGRSRSPRRRRSGSWRSPPAGRRR